MTFQDFFALAAFKTYMLPFAGFVNAQNIGGPIRLKIKRIKYHIECCILAIESLILPELYTQWSEPSTALVQQLSNFSGQLRWCKWLEGGMCPWARLRWDEASVKMHWGRKRYPYRHHIQSHSIFDTFSVIPGVSFSSLNWIQLHLSAVDARSIRKTIMHRKMSTTWTYTLQQKAEKYIDTCMMWSTTYLL